MSAILDPWRQQAAPLPESDQLWEVIDGRRVEKQVSAYAAWIAVQLSKSLDRFFLQAHLGLSQPETVFILNAKRNLRRRPDVAVLLSETWPLDTPPPQEGDWPVVPDIAVEVLSPGNRYAETQRKLRDYFRYGVKEAWIVSPDERIVRVHRSPTQLREVAPGELLTSELLPGFSLDVARLLPHPEAEFTAEP